MTREGLTRAAIVAMGLSVALAGCATRSHSRTGDPLTDALNPGLSVNVRIRAVEQARADIGEGAADPDETRRVMKGIVWAGATPTQLRLSALATVFDEPGYDQDSRKMAGFLLPQEKDPQIVEFIANEAVERAWEDVTPALVRCYSKRETRTPDELRPEHQALLKLNPDKTIAQIVFDIFLVPGVEGGFYGLDWAELTRADAWDLLGRLDTDGVLRANLLVSDEYDHLEGPSAQLREDLRNCVHDLHTIPLNAAELTWLQRLRDPDLPRNQQWWDESVAAMDQIPTQMHTNLRLRHVEPIRWTAAQRPEWLAADPDQLFDILETRLEDRRFHRRSARARESDPLLQEKLRSLGVQLQREDLLTILAIDDALASESVRAALFEQAQLDYEDKTTEYGGVLGPAPDEDATMQATLFPPRPAARVGDERFVASKDMLRASDRALAHYHFHVQAWGNARYAGPSLDDRVYAWRQGRACIVFTGIRHGVLGVDYYQSNGRIVDLGEITPP